MPEGAAGRASRSSRSTPTASGSPPRACAGNCCARPGNTTGTRSTASWRHRTQVRDVPIETGALDIAADAPAIAVAQPAGRPLSLGGHRCGERRAVEPALPCRLVCRGGAARRARQARSERSTSRSYQPGETAKLFVKAPFAGEAEVAIASDRILAMRSISAAGRAARRSTSRSMPTGAAASMRWSAPIGRGALAGPGAAAARSRPRGRRCLARRRSRRRAPSAVS